MDFKQENINLGMNEKNKKLFQDMKITDKNQTGEETKEVNSFKLYNEFVKEKSGIIEIVKEICEFGLFTCGKNTNKNSKNIKDISELINYKNRIIMLMEEYQEAPGLLDPILSDMVTEIMQNSLPIIEALLKNENPEKNENMLLCLRCLYQIIYILCKIRGRQTIIKFFCSEVYVFEPVISILLSLDSSDPENCDVIFVLILWTSILGLIPFDVETIDTKGIIINELPKYFKKTLNSSSNLRDITAYALSKFITRPDIIKKGLLEEILNFYIEFLQDEKRNTNIFMCAGVMSSLYEIFKNGIPTDLTKFVGPVVKNVINYKFPEYMLTGGIMRRYFSKLTTRIGMIILKPKFQKWRYSKQLKNLLDKNKLEEEDDKNIDVNNPEENEAFDYELDFETLEILIDKMLNSLIDKEYIVRWSTAKGLGRICERLTKNMVDDILENIFELFNDEENEFSWQGGILAIAELCKRGMILPEKLAKVMHYLEKAFIFEVNKGTFCLGSNVRDSACYLAWALARAYSKKVMTNYIKKLAQNLIIVMLFDKEVNCRRAASAAFQEHVGRQGYFPNGIEIITEADYFTLGNRSNCFLNISTFVSLFPDYRHVVLDYLSSNRILHVEENIRILSAEALGLLVPFDDKYFIEKIIPNLIQVCFSSNLAYRQGAIMGIGYILVGLKGKWDFEMKSKRIRMKVLEGMNAVESKVLEDSEYRKNFEEKFLEIKFVDHLTTIKNNEIYFEKYFKNLQKEIFSLPNLLEKKNLYRGKGGEIMRTAINNFIKLICVAELELEEIYILQYFDILIENLKHPNLDIQKDACIAISCLMNQIEDCSKKNILSAEGKKEIENKVKDILKNSISEESIYVNRGYTMCLSYLSEEYIKENFEEILKNLFFNCKVKMQKNNNVNLAKEKNEAEIRSNYNDFETRRISIESLCDITIKLSKSKDNLENLRKYFDQIFEYIFDGLKDYEIDKKFGDVGALIRKSAIKSLTSIMLHCFNNVKKDQIFSDLFTKNGKLFICALFKQLAEKLNKIRHSAGENLQFFFHEINKAIKKDNETLQENNNLLTKAIPEFKKLSEFFLNDLRFNDIGEIYNIDWLEPSYCFEKVSEFLLYEDYSFSVFEGMIISIGGLTEDVQRFSLLAIDDIIKKDSTNEIIRKIYSHIIQILKNNEKNDRVIEPLFNTMAHLLTNNYFIESEYFEFVDLIHLAIKKENYESKNITKVLSSVDILYNILFFKKEEKYDLFKRTLRSILIMMSHKYPVVRKKAAEKLFLYLSTEDPSELGVTDEENENISIILCDVNWCEPIAIIRDSRNEIANMLKVNLDNLVKK